ncbi:MAG: metallophosphoesterase [Desulfosarcina sp.]|nr:metallophosphoesterase [Desulfobacterales bacterium]
MPADTPSRPPIKTSQNLIRVGVLSDTHGHLNPDVLTVLEGVDLIIHTGDIDSADILTTLARIAPVYPVRGNMDFGDWVAVIPTEDIIEVGGIMIYARHDLSKISLDPEAAGIRVILSGHTHQPEAYWHADRLYLNPGSASQPRYGHAPSVALLEISGSRLTYHFIVLREE